MKILLVIWVIVMAVLLIVGWTMVGTGKEKELQRERGYKLVAVSNGMMAAFFLFELIFIG